MAQTILIIQKRNILNNPDNLKKKLPRIESINQMNYAWKRKQAKNFLFIKSIDVQLNQLVSLPVYSSSIVHCCLKPNKFL
jgi:hypothetical protein